MDIGIENGACWNWTLLCWGVPSCEDRLDCAEVNVSGPAGLGLDVPCSGSLFNHSTFRCLFGLYITTNLSKYEFRWHFSDIFECFCEVQMWRMFIEDNRLKLGECIYIWFYGRMRFHGMRREGFEEKHRFYRPSNTHYVAPFIGMLQCQIHTIIRDASRTNLARRMVINLKYHIQMRLEITTWNDHVCTLSLKRQSYNFMKNTLSHQGILTIQIW